MRERCRQTGYLCAARRTWAHEYHPCWYTTPRPRRTVSGVPLSLDPGTHLLCRKVVWVETANKRRTVDTPSLVFLLDAEVVLGHDPRVREARQGREEPRL